MLGRLLLRRQPLQLCRGVSSSISAACPPAKVGDRLQDVDTPALLVDLGECTGRYREVLDASAQA